MNYPTDCANRSTSASDRPKYTTRPDIGNGFVTAIELQNGERTEGASLRSAGDGKSKIESDGFVLHYKR